MRLSASCFQMIENRKRITRKTANSLRPADFTCASDFSDPPTLYWFLFMPDDAEQKPVSDMIIALVRQAHPLEARTEFTFQVSKTKQSTGTFLPRDESAEVLIEPPPPAKKTRRELVTTIYGAARELQECNSKQIEWLDSDADNMRCIVEYIQSDPRRPAAMREKAASLRLGDLMRE